MYDECKQFGVKFLHNSNALHIHTDENQTRLTHVDIKTEGSSELVRLPCSNLVVSAGSLSDKVFSQLFPHVRYQIPMAQKQPAQNWLRIRNPKWNPGDDDKDCDQGFLISGPCQ